MVTAIILAGGLGTRLRSVVPDLPKPMAPISGKPFLAYLLEYWIRQGVNHVILSVGYRHEAITSYFGNQYHGVQIDYAIESEPLGTGGALRLAARQCKSRHGFLLLNGDTFFPVDLSSLQDFAQSHRTGLCLSLFKTFDTKRYLGIGLDPDGVIISLNAPSHGKQHLANGGVYWCVPERLQLDTHASGTCSLENDVLPILLSAEYKLAALQFNAPFIDIGIPDDYHRAEQFLLQGAL